MIRYINWLTKIKMFLIPHMGGKEKYSVIFDHNGVEYIGYIYVNYDPDPVPTQYIPYPSTPNIQVFVMDKTQSIIAKTVYLMTGEIHDVNTLMALNISSYLNIPKENQYSMTEYYRNKLNTAYKMLTTCLEESRDDLDAIFFKLKNRGYLICPMTNTDIAIYKDYRCTFYKKVSQEELHKYL